jgi:hypothetical protein
LVADLAHVNRRFLQSPGFRRATMTALAAPSTPLELSAATLRERDGASDAARPYAGLSGAALALVGVERDENAVPAVRLVLAELDPQRIFAGVDTALRAADRLAERLGMPLCVIVLSEAITVRHRGALLDAVTERLVRDPAQTSVLTRGELIGARTHPRDVWVATHWTTAHPLQVASHVGVIDPARVVYLVQDHEAGFTALSSDRVIASETYRAGFQLLVNSEPVAAVLRSLEGVTVDPAAVFAPVLDLDRLATVASQRAGREQPPSPVTVFFYGRPSKPRNLFTLGIAALKVAAQALPNASVRWVSAGESHRAIDLGNGHHLESLGTLDWTQYFDLLSTTDVVLSLQASPHPSHPPLEAALSGATSITNEVAGTRASLHPRLVAASANPEELGLEVARAVQRAVASSRAAADVPTLESLAPLGGTLDDALEHVVTVLSS